MKVDNARYSRIGDDIMEYQFFRDELAQMKDNYKKNPLQDLKLCRPEWLESDDPMSEIYSKKTMLLQQGEITYACIVQANTFLFQRFPPVACCPAQILYSRNSYIGENPQIIHDIANKLYWYKGVEDSGMPKEWEEIAKVLRDELDRSDFTFPVEADDELVECHFLPIMIYRKLLPKRKLCSSILPVLFAPGCKQVLVLPKEYWTKKFKEVWIRGMNDYL